MFLMVYQGFPDFVTGNLKVWTHYQYFPLYSLKKLKLERLDDRGDELLSLMSAMMYISKYMWHMFYLFYFIFFYFLKRLCTNEQWTMVGIPVVVHVPQFEKPCCIQPPEWQELNITIKHTFCSHMYTCLQNNHFAFREFSFLIWLLLLCHQTKNV
jgi:hypothetical protein